MTTGYKRIFWGILIATFHITIGIITILPAFVGWVVVLQGLSELEEGAPGGDFARPRMSAIILIVASLGGGILSLIGGSNIDSFLPMLFYPVFVTALELVVFHKILEVSVHHFNGMNQQEISDRYTGKDRTYIILTGMTMVLLAISITFNHETAGFLGAAMAVVSRIYLLTVINSLSKEDDKTEDQEMDDEVQALENKLDHQLG